jgi:hypothetical protein
MAAMPDRRSRAIPFNALKPFNGYGFADLVASRRCAPAHCALPNRINHPVAQVLRIWLRHSCWPPPSQQVESECPRFGNPHIDSSQRQPALIGEAVAVAGVSVVAVGTITGVVAVEAAIEESVAETAAEPSFNEAATEPSIAEAESAIAEAAMEAFATEAAMEASASGMETPSTSGANTRHGWGVAIERPRAKVAKDPAIDLKSDTCMIDTPICQFELGGSLDR